MGKDRSRKNTPLVILIILLSVVLAATGVAAYFTDGFHSLSKIKDVISGITGETVFYCNDVEIKAGNTIDLSAGPAQLRANNTNFTVKVVANPAAAFDFTVSGQLAGFGVGNTDYTAGFRIGEADKSATLNAPVSMQSALAAAFPGQTIAVIPEIDVNKAYFIAVVTTENGSAFSVYLKGAVRFAYGGVTVNPPEVEF